jgi:hypothetical protein
MGAVSIGVSWNKICCSRGATGAKNILEDSSSKPSISAQETNQVSLCMDQGFLCNTLQGTEYQFDIARATGSAHS